MADISILSRLVLGYQRNIDVSQNALIVGSIKIGTSSPVEITKTIATILIAVSTVVDSDGTYDTRYYTKTQINSTTNGSSGAKQVGVSGTPTNYTPSSADVQAHLVGIDSALTTAIAGSGQVKNTSADTTADYLNNKITVSSGLIKSTTSPSGNEKLNLAVDPSVYVAVSQKGAASGVATLDSNSLIPITQIPPAALERLVVVADQTARFALTTTTVQNGDTVKQTDTNIMYFIVDDTNLGNSTGYVTYSAGTAAAVAWSGVTGTPTTLSGYGITDYAAAAKAAAVADAITDGVTDVAPSQNAVFDALALKAPLASPTFTGTVSGITKTMVGLGNVDNTADANKAVLSATAIITSEIAGESLSITTLVALRYAIASDASFVVGRMYKADIDSSVEDKFDVQGLAYPAGAVSAAGAVTIVQKGLINVPSHGFTVGLPLWLAASGVITQTAPSSVVNSAVVKVGTVKDANNINVNISVVQAG